MADKTVTMREDLMQETLIALQDRRMILIKECTTTDNQAIYDIANRQLSRVTYAMEQIQLVLGVYY